MSFVFLYGYDALVKGLISVQPLRRRSLGRPNFRSLNSDVVPKNTEHLRKAGRTAKFNWDL